MTGLQCRELSFAFGDRSVINELSLSPGSGELMVLLGANGAGKTTLLKLLSGQLSPGSGSVRLDDRDVSEFSIRDLAKHIALMPQHEERTTSLRVIDVVRLGRSPHRGWWAPLNHDDHQIVNESLLATGMQAFRDRIVTELSGGEWRRMILARSLAQCSPILLLDEPTAGLDLKFQLDVLHRLKDMTRQRQLTIVMTLHDLNLAAMFADRIAVLANHNLLAVGTPREVLTSETIRRAFDVEVSVIDHPSHDAPLLVPLTVSVSDSK